MKKLQILTRYILAVTLLISCADPNREILEKAPGGKSMAKQYEAPACLTILLGDKDGFGTGMKEGDPLHIPGGTPLPIDHRLSDPLFTDVWPADINATGNVTRFVAYTMTFNVPSEIGSASFHLTTLGIQDGDKQVFSSDTDIKLFLDGQEVPNAFDTIDQFDCFPIGWSDFVSTFEVAIPENLLHVLSDGSVDVRWEIHQLFPGQYSFDGFAIDYCELEICPAIDRR